MGGSKIKDDLAFRVYKEKTGKMTLVFSISAKLCREMRWMSGDRLDVLFDAEAMQGQLIRCKGGGWCLCPLGGKDSDTTRKALRVTWRKEYGFPDKGREIAWEVTDNTVVFTL